MNNKLNDIRELIALLKAAKCPECDGSGLADKEYYVLCQWCYKRDELIKKYMSGNINIAPELTKIRNELYDSLPKIVGEINAFDLTIVIKKHLEKLDHFIDEMK